jgi:hypothetical protein
LHGKDGDTNSYEKNQPVKELHGFPSSRLNLEKRFDRDSPHLITLLKYLLPIYPCGLNHQFPFIFKQYEIGRISRNDLSPHIWK